ncbi:MAG: hypothetical protein ACREOI_15715 [bacterium]
MQQRAYQTLEWWSHEYNLFSFALDKLSLGRAYTQQALAEGTNPLLRASAFTQAKDYLNQAVEVLRKADRQDYLPRALFARAALYRLKADFAKAEADLEEAREIAERGEMNLHLADYHLEACRLCLAQRAEGMAQKAKEHLETASAMIEKMGYGRRKPEVEALRREIEELKI